MVLNQFIRKDLFMDDQTYLLLDIKNLKEISFAPPSYLFVVFSIIFLLIFVLFFSTKKNEKWQVTAKIRLYELLKNNKDVLIKQNLADFSQILRFIAIKSSFNRECASLTGEKWLNWLSNNDPKNFDWLKNGRILINDNYSPNNMGLKACELKLLIKAALKWIR